MACLCSKWEKTLMCIFWFLEETYNIKTYVLLQCTVQKLTTEKKNGIGYSICVIGYCDVRCVCVYYCSTVKHDHQRTVSSSHFHRNCVVYIYDMHLLTIHRAVPICSCAICMTSSCYDSVVCASRYNAITSIWLSGATDNVERTLQEPHHRVTDELYSCSLP